MAVQVELWKKEIIVSFFRKNAFLSFSTDLTSEVLNGKVVHIANSGGASGAQRNRIVLPAGTILQRADTDVTYSLDSFTSDPMLVTAMEQADLAYEKMQSMIDENGAMMLALAGDAILEYWSRNVPNNTTFRVSTTGAAKPVGGLTGTRKKLTAADIRSLQTLFDQADVPTEDRYLIITPDMRQDLIEDADIKNIFFQVVDYKMGTLPIYAGFSILIRSKTIRLTTAGATVLPDPGTAVLGTDNFAGIAFQKSCVEHALGEIKVFMQTDIPQLYGDTMSMLFRTGGRGRRADNKGVVLLVQAP